MDSETLSLVLIIVGTLLLVIMMSGSGENCRQHSASCGCGACSGFAGSRRVDRFTNADPRSGLNKIPASLGTDYGSAIKRMALEDDVEKSHSAWLGEFAHRTTTASKESIRDDPNNVVVPMGLAAMMRQNTQYRSRAQPLANSRTIPSDIPSDMGGNTPSLSFYGHLSD